MRLVPGQIDARKTKPTFTKRHEFHKDVKKKHPRKNLLLKTPKLQLWWYRGTIHFWKKTKISKVSWAESEPDISSSRFAQTQFTTSGSCRSSVTTKPHPLYACVCMCTYLHLSPPLSLRLWRPSTLDHGAAECFVVYLSTDEKAISDNKQDITSAESMRLFAMLAIVSNGHWSSDGVLGSTNLTFQHPILHRRTTTTTTTNTTLPLLLLLLYYLLTTSPTAAAGLGDGRRED